MLLDLASGIGVQLLWPFHTHWSGIEIIGDLDLWILLLLVCGLLLPLLFGLVSEEVGARKKGPRGRVAALVTLGLIVAYFSWRADLHSRAVDLLLSREYHGRGGAFWPRRFRPAPCRINGAGSWKPMTPWN